MLKNKKNSQLSNQTILKVAKGYTIVELLVVMGIIAILLPLTFGGYNGIRKQKYVQHVANTAQTEIRGTFIDTIATRVDSSTGKTCSGKSPQIKVLRIQLSTSVSAPMKKILFCDDGSTLVSSANATEEPIDMLQGLNYSKPLRVKCTGCATTEVASGYLYIAFISPYGKYYSFYTSSTNDSTANSNFRSLSTTTTAIGWEKDNSLAYKPTNSGLLNLLTGDIIISFDSNTDTSSTGIIHKITVSKNGSVKLD